MFTKEYLNRFYGDKIQVEFHDVADPAAYEANKHLIDKASQGYCVYPLVFLNDDLKSVGNAEYYQVLRYVRRFFEVIEGE